MKILLLGAAGQVGHELLPLLRQRGEVIAPSRSDLDLADKIAAERLLRQVRPELIVNTIAYNEVDRAEAEPDAAFRINAEAVAMLGLYAREARAALIHYSTDFVFDGKKGAPYVETDETNPLSAYGRSKLAGERALAEMEAPALVLRTAWLYSLRRRSFVSTMLKLVRERKELALVINQFGSPTSAADLARATAEVVDTLGAKPGTRALEVRGIYHAAAEGWCSRAELAEAAFELDPRSGEHTVERISHVTADAFPLPAPRPANSALVSDRLRERFGVSLPPWRESLARALAASDASLRAGD
jgi:dTDP-4-dehydrorhamnose reductase